MKLPARLGRSILVGLVATAVDAAVLMLLILVASVRPAYANLPSLAAGIAVQFVGNKRFAFRDPSPLRVSQGARFLAVEAGAIALNGGIFHLLVTATPCPPLPARLATAAAVYVAFSFPLWKWAFAPPRNAS